MNKQKSQQSKKRRDAAKRRKALKRKPQRAVAKPSRDTKIRLTNRSTLSQRKLSEVLLEFAEPMIEATDDITSEEDAVRMSITLWNASLQSKEAGIESITTAVDKIHDGDSETLSDYLNIFETMYARKQELFPNDKRFSVDYSLTRNEDSIYLEVASTPTNS